MGTIDQVRVKHPLLMLLIIITVILLPAVIMSFELCDTGFYLTFYQNFFSAPESVEYNFMFYLSGLFGALIDLFGGSWGLLIMRAAGLLFLLGATVIAWRYPSDTVTANVKTIAIIAIMAGYASSPIIVSYDIVTLLFLVLGVYLLVKGILQKSRKLLFISGVITGMLLFIRIPNLLQFFLVILIPLYLSASKRDKLWLSFLFIGGYIVGLLIIIGLMASLGHIGIFLQNIETLRALSADTEASHGLGHLIMTQINYYWLLAIIVVKFTLMALCIRGIWYFLSSKWMRTILSLPFMLYFIYMAYHISPVLITGAVVLPALIMMCFQRKLKKESLIAAGALLSSLIFPLGSDGGGGNIGSILYLLGAAPALGFWLNLKFNIKGIELFVPRNLIITAACIFPIICVIKIFCGGLYFDDTPLWKMTTQSASPKLRGILMSEERSRIVDEIIPVLERYVSPRDTLFAYGSIPMLNYLTYTRPYIGNSWPEQVSAGRLEQLLRVEEEKNNYPVICIQKFRTIGDNWGEPSEAFMKGEDNDSNIYHSKKKWMVMQEFLDRNQYHTVASTPHFDVLNRLPKE